MYKRLDYPESYLNNKGIKMTAWEKRVEVEVKKMTATGDYDYLPEAICIWLQEIAECHALLAKFKKLSKEVPK